MPFMATGLVCACFSNSAYKAALVRAHKQSVSVYKARCCEKHRINILVKRQFVLKRQEYKVRLVVSWTFHVTHTLMSVK